MRKTCRARVAGGVPWQSSIVGSIKIKRAADGGDVNNRSNVLLMTALSSTTHSPSFLSSQCVTSTSAVALPSFVFSPFTKTLKRKVGSTRVLDMFVMFRTSFFFVCLLGVFFLRQRRRRSICVSITICSFLDPVSVEENDHHVASTTTPQREAAPSSSRFRCNARQAAPKNGKTRKAKKRTLPSNNKINHRRQRSIPDTVTLCRFRKRSGAFPFQWFSLSSPSTMYSTLSV